MRLQVRMYATVLLVCVAFVAGRLGAGAHARAATPAMRYAPFAGSWFSHGSGLVIGPAGHGTVSYRTYTNCTPTVVTGCDKFIGNTIYSGGFAHFALHHMAGNSATGTVTDSAFSWQMGVPVTLRFRPGNDTVTLRFPGVNAIFCGRHSPPGFCGA